MRREGEAAGGTQCRGKAALLGWKLHSVLCRAMVGRIHTTDQGAHMINNGVIFVLPTQNMYQNPVLNAPLGPDGKPAPLWFPVVNCFAVVGTLRSTVMKPCSDSK